MDREQARQEIKSRIKCTDFLQPSKGSQYHCPFCGSGSGRNGTGALTYYPETNTFHCFSCDKSGDAIDLYMITAGADYNTALIQMADELGIEIDPYRPMAAEDFDILPEENAVKAPRSDEKGRGNINTLTKKENPSTGTLDPLKTKLDYMSYYKECRDRLKDPAAISYLNGRGISIETAAAYWLGYDPEWSSPTARSKGKKPPQTPRIIIPSSTSHYVARDIRQTLSEKQKTFAKMNEGKPEIFNIKSLFTQEVQSVFVVEGVFDALSIIEAGGTAIALNSASNKKILVEQLKKKKTEATLILCPDNDKDPKTREKVGKLFEELAADLQRIDIAYIRADICGEWKDANEALVADREKFTQEIENARRQAGVKPDNTSHYIDSLMADDIQRFKQDKKTGFSNLDEKAGGLYSGLYCLAAISSLGKTSFALQMADQLAEAGNDVIFFSLEQSRLELVSKSFARRTSQKDMEKAVTSLAIRKGYIPKQVLEAANEYKAAIGDRISIVEGNFNCDISFIGDYIRHYVRRTNTRPVVFLDYLQILQPADDGRRQSTKEAIDSTVTQLKRLSRELDLTIIIISSVNRQNYLTPIDFESLKESGCIEFTCDVVWGLQLQCLHDEIFSKEKSLKEKREKIKAAKAANPRKIEMVCLKNRYGIANYSCYFNFYPANDLFTVEDEADFGFLPTAGE